MVDPTEMPNNLSRKPGATEAQISKLSQLFEGRPPSDYIAFLQRSNGAEGPLGSEAYLAIWPADQVSELNKAYAVDEFAPGLVLFGTDGGNTGYAFDTSKELHVVEVPLVGMDLNEARPIAPTFTGFLDALEKRKGD